MRSHMPVLHQCHKVPTALGDLYAESWTPQASSLSRLDPLVLLHDSLGCVALWRDFPAQLAQTTHRQVIAYDRRGFGRSTPRADRLPFSFVTDEAHDSFAAILEYFALTSFAVLGHSVGGGMAIGCAAAHPERCSAVVTLAAQSFVEPKTLDGIRQAQAYFSQSEPFKRLTHHHGPQASWVLSAWLDTWLEPAFLDWQLDSSLATVSCPGLFIHGERDPYGSTEQAKRISRQSAGSSTLRLIEECGHNPHRERTQQVLSDIQEFLA